MGPGGLGAPLGCSLGVGAARRAAGLNVVRTGGPEVPLGRAGSPLSPAGLRPCCVAVRGDGALPGGAARPFPQRCRPAPDSRCGGRCGCR